MGFGATKAPSAIPLPPPQAVNPALKGAWDALFGGNKGAGATGIQTLTDTAAGKAGSPGSASDVTQLFAAIKAAGAQTHQEDIGSLRSSFAASGMSMGTDMMNAIGRQNSQYESNLLQTDQSLTFQASEAAKNRQLAAATGLEETFSNIANTFAPSAQIAGGAQSGNLGSSLIGAGASTGSTIATLIMMGIL